MRWVWAMAAAFALSGCTAMLWEEESEAVRVDAGADAIVAFGVAGEAVRGQLSAGTLVMMGERFWYALYNAASQDLLPVLQADLPERFRIMDADDGAELVAIPIEVSGYDDRDFKSEFCLKYPASGVVRSRLEALEFYQVKGGDYVRCFTARGHLYTSPKTVAENYRFATAVPVALFRYDFRPRGGMGKALLTPVAIAADAVGMMTVYPAAALGVQAGGGLKMIQ